MENTAMVMNTKTVRELRAFVEKIERLEGQRAGIGADIKDTYDTADSRGFDKKVLRRLIRERKRDRETLRHEAAILESYRDALEMPGFADACKEAERANGGNEVVRGDGKVIRMADKIIEQLVKIKKNKGQFRAVRPSQYKEGERLEEQGLVKLVKEGVWQLTEYGEAQIPDELFAE